MASLPFSGPNMSVSHDDDLYCSDPDCAYCKDLRAEEQWKKAREEQAKRAEAA